MLFIKCPQKYIWHGCYYWCFSSSLVRAEKRVGIFWVVVKVFSSPLCWLTPNYTPKAIPGLLLHSHFQGSQPTWEPLWTLGSLELQKGLLLLHVGFVKSRLWFCLHQVRPGQTQKRPHWLRSEPSWNAWPHFPRRLTRRWRGLLPYLLQGVGTDLEVGSCAALKLHSAGPRSSPGSFLLRVSIPGAICAWGLVGDTIPTQGREEDSGRLLPAGTRAQPAQ